MEQSYKEKYEKALEKAKEYKNVYKDHTMMSYAKGALEDIFPELAESEDEKIRKVLIKFFSMGAKYNLHTDGIADKDIVAWLEKQKQTEWSENDKAFLDDILCKLEYDLILNKDEKDWLKSLKQRIQKGE